MRLITKVIRISRANFRCNRLTTVQYIQDYASLIFLGYSIYFVAKCWTTHSRKCFSRAYFKLSNSAASKTQ